MIWIIAVVIPALNRRHFKNIPYDFCLAGLIFSLPLITIGAADAFGWMLAYLRGASVIADWITSIRRQRSSRLMMLLPGAAARRTVGDLVEEPVPSVTMFVPLGDTR